MLPSINFHLWKPCNFKCKFCFATYEDAKALYNKKSYLSKEEMILIIDEIAKFGIRKITFAGGEPLLCKWLDELILRAKNHGITTMIVTNGWFLTEQWLDKQNGNLDWVTISIDSLNHVNQMKIGRSNKNKTLSATDYKEKIKMLKDRGIRFKMNTVVNSINVQEDMTSFIKETLPERWKIFQVLPIKNQNDIYIDELLISNDDYIKFVDRHRSVINVGVDIVEENNNLMKGSYLMIDPQGRFYDNVNGIYHYSQSILDVGYEKALEEVQVYKDKFIERNGLYEWA